MSNVIHIYAHIYTTYFLFGLIFWAQLDCASFSKQALDSATWRIMRNKFKLLVMKEYCWSTEYHFKMPHNWNTQLDFLLCGDTNSGHHLWVNSSWVNTGTILQDMLHKQVILCLFSSFIYALIAYFSVSFSLL